MLKGRLSIPYGLAKVHPQLTAKDMLKIQELRDSKEYSDWSELFKDFLRENGEVIPKDFVDTDIESSI